MAPSGPLIPQFATSTDPGVIAALEHNDAELTRFLEITKKISLKYTGESDRAIGHTGPGRPHISGLRVSREEFEQLPGSWLKRDKGTTRPYKDNPAYQDFRIKTSYQEIPGRPDIVWGEGYIGRGGVFLHNGVAYSGFGFRPSDTDPQAELWTEVTSSVVHDAIAARKATTPPRERT